MRSINSQMDIASRIQEVIRKNQLNAAKFADRIGVQRSNLSHVLTGRNKPGLDFIEKVLIEFPNIDANWLITGTESPTDKSNVTGRVQENQSISAEKRNNTIVNSKTLADQKIVSQTEKDAKVEKVIVFYSNGTFDEFKK